MEAINSPKEKIFKMVTSYLCHIYDGNGAQNWELFSLKKRVKTEFFLRMSVQVLRIGKHNKGSDQYGITSDMQPRKGKNSLVADYL